MAYYFGNHSTKTLKTCHTDLQLIAKEALKWSPLDFKIVEGYRSIARQQALYLEGKTKIDGINKLGKHNRNPSMAFDIVVNNKHTLTWKDTDMCFVAGVILSVGARLFEEDKVTHKLRWGGNWDGDGIILSDQKFDDMPHFELI